MSKKLNEISEELRRSETKNEEMKRNADKATGQAQKAEQEVANLRNSLKSMHDSQNGNEKKMKELQAILQVRLMLYIF